jgi:hypothetical protein
MPQCPQCNKPLRELVRRCPSCQADLDLLVDYVSHLRGGLERAQDLTMAGELGHAVWAYLEILEVDPDNAAAKKQVAQVATAVRQFDRAAPGRAWLDQSRNGTPGQTNQPKRIKLVYLAWAGVILVAFALGYLLGSFANSAADETPADPPPPLQRKDDRSLGG